MTKKFRCINMKFENPKVLCKNCIYKNYEYCDYIRERNYRLEGYQKPKEYYDYINSTLDIKEEELL